MVSVAAALRAITLATETIPPPPAGCDRYRPIRSSHGWGDREDRASSLLWIELRALTGLGQTVGRAERVAAMLAAFKTVPVVNAVLADPPDLSLAGRLMQAGARDLPSVDSLARRWVGTFLEMCEAERQADQEQADHQPAGRVTHWPVVPRPRSAAVAKSPKFSSSTFFNFGANAAPKRSKSGSKPAKSSAYARTLGGGRYAAAMRKRSPGGGS